MKTISSVFILLIVSPALAEAALLYLQPDFAGGRCGFLSFICSFLFSLPFVFVTIPLWPTYIPAIVFTPIVMRQVSMLPKFRNMKLAAILGIAFFVGAVVGVLVLAWFIVTSARDSSSEALSWVGAGVFSGSITLALITLIYRYEPPRTNDTVELANDCNSTLRQQFPDEFF